MSAFEDSFSDAELSEMAEDIMNDPKLHTKNNSYIFKMDDDTMDDLMDDLMMKSPSINGNPQSNHYPFTFTHSGEYVLSPTAEQSNFTTFTKQNTKFSSCFSPKQRSNAICIKSKRKKNPFQRLDQHTTNKKLPSVNTLINAKNLEFGVINHDDLPSTTELQLAFTLSL